MKKLLLTISYVGTGFCGWQVQADGLRTVQATVQDAIEAVYGERHDLTGCSRTDAGVHAKAFRAAYVLPDDSPDIPLERLPLALNLKLPYDCAVIKAEEVPLPFHPRYDAVYKEYKYIFEDTVHRDPFMDKRCWHFHRPLDESAMDAASKAFLGTHDFSAFMSTGGKIEDTARTVTDISVSRENGFVTMTIRADGYLYNMVRIIAGTLAMASYGKINPSELPSIIASGDRNKAGMTAPPEGLYLTEVGYLEGFAKLKR